MTEELPPTVEQLANRAAWNDRDQRIDAMIRIGSALYDRAATYTNLILVAGYAAYFTIWANMREILSHDEMLWAALAISISLVVFIAWEVTQMIVRAHLFRGLSEAIHAQTPEEVDAALIRHAQNEGRIMARVYRWWIVVLVLTIVPALSGSGILISAFIHQLFATSPVS